MTASDIAKELTAESGKDKCIVKFWRRGSNSAEYEFVEKFLFDCKQDEDFAGFKLLTRQEVVDELGSRKPTRVFVRCRDGENVICWQYLSENNEVEREDVFQYEMLPMISRVQH